MFAPRPPVRCPRTSKKAFTTEAYLVERPSASPRNFSASSRLSASPPRASVAAATAPANSDANRSAFDLLSEATARTLARRAGNGSEVASSGGKPSSRKSARAFFGGVYRGGRERGGYTRGEGWWIGRGPRFKKLNRFTSGVARTTAVLASLHNETSAPQFWSKGITILTWAQLVPRSIQKDFWGTKQCGLRKASCAPFTYTSAH